MIHPNTVAKAYAKFVQSGDRTALLSSHLLDDLERVADRILIMVNGRMAVDCPLESLVHRVSSCTVELDDDTTELGHIPRVPRMHIVDGDGIVGITNLLGPKRSVVVGGFKSPNRLRWLAHR